MAYGDSVDPKSRVVSIVLVGIITFLLGWLLVSGLAIEAVKKVAEQLDVMDVEEPEVPEEPPPPPPPDNELPPPPPVVIPKSIIPPLNNQNVIRDAVDTPPPPQPPTPIITPPAPPAPPAAPPPTPDRSRAASPRGNAQSWVTTDDYPSSAQREGVEGTTGTRMSIGADGRVTDCQVTSSSGNTALDNAACSNLRRRARYNPALDRDGNPTTSTATRNVRWQLPED